MAIVGNWVGEITTTEGDGTINLGGALTGHAPFSTLDGSEVWYGIVDGNNREAGIGTLTNPTTLERTTVYSTLVDGAYADSSPEPIELSGLAQVFCTFNKSAFDEFTDGLSRLTTAENKLATIETGATTDQTASEIKTAYESNSDTNPFTDANLSKLENIAAGATTDQNASQVPYDNTTSGLSATNVKDAIDEVEGQAGDISNLLAKEPNWDDAYSWGDHALAGYAVKADSSNEFSGSVTAGTYIGSEQDDGGPALTTNDGQGNSNLTFNHTNGVPSVTGTSGRIIVNKDATSNPTMTFELGLGTAGVSVALPTRMTLSDNNLQIDRIRLTSTTDASLSSTNHAYQIGSTSANNLIVDTNEIMARNNGAAATLFINPLGGKVTFGANIECTSWTTTSDKRKKIIKKALSVDECREILKKIQWVKFDWKDGSDANIPGLIAQELLEIYPDAVKLDEKGYYSVNYQSLFVMQLRVDQDNENRISRLEKLVEGLV